MRPSRWLLFSSAALLLVAVALFLRTDQAPPAAYIPYSDARPILESLGERLPTELRGLGGPEAARDWLDWVERRDREIRSRLALGDEDSVVNLMLFGTSFTDEPRVTDAVLAQVPPNPQTGRQVSVDEIGTLIQRRAAALVDAAFGGDDDERLALARVILPDDRAAAPRFLLESLLRVATEQVGYARMLEEARALDDPSRQFAESSRLYRERGLSLDTSLRPNFAVEESLAALRERGFLTPGSVRRVAVVGPGLDFIDKQAGYDFYPVQTIQPFAVMDSLLRLQLAEPAALELVTLDLSPRVNAHVARFAERARSGADYTLQLPRDPGAGWHDDFVRYWERFGDQIGTAVEPVTLPGGLERLLTRAVRVRSEIAARVTAEDLNLVLQRVGGEPFDLIVATNVFIYYDVFEQCLALKNVEQMLRPGGFLLSNNALLELPSSRVRSAGYLATSYSHEGDHIVWYRRLP